MSSAKTGWIASEVTTCPIEYLLSPWIAKGCLSMVVGDPGSGKSTFTGWIARAASSCLWFAGTEESIPRMLVPRLRHLNCDLAAIRLMYGHEWRMPRDTSAILELCSVLHVTLIVADPIDSFLDERCSENSAQDIRSYLESWARLAEATGAAVIGVRHPGKEDGNIMPGSRAWRAVPRSIVQMVMSDRAAGRGILRHYKDSMGQGAASWHYQMSGDRGRPKSFTLGEEVDRSEDGLSEVSETQTIRRKVIEAARLIRCLFEGDRAPRVAELINWCARLGIGEKARDEAKRLLDVVCGPIVRGGEWVMSRRTDDWPTWVPGVESTPGVVSPAETAET
jgi:hypothetical protein